MTELAEVSSFIRPTSTKQADEFYNYNLRGMLCIKKCSGCETWHHIPREMCSTCGSLDLEWTQCSGSGVLFTWTETVAAPLPVLQSDVPFVVALVQLDEGPRVVARLVNVESTQLALGLRLRVKFLTVEIDFSLAVFEPA